MNQIQLTLGVIFALYITLFVPSFVHAQTSLIGGPTPADTQPGPVEDYTRALRPGSVYKEYKRINTRDDWRVTGPDATHADAAQFLPNPVISFPAVDLEHATHAEVVLSYWSGHPGTDGKKMRTNGKEWIPLPTTPTLGANEKKFYVNSNPVITVPLTDFNASGVNTFEGTACCKSWPQWGWMSIMVRIYYDPVLKQGAPAVSITSPVSGSTLHNNQQITTAAGTAERIDILGYYQGLDEDGDGHYLDWHGDTIVERKNSAETMALQNHIGSGQQVNWDTALVPNQRPGAIKLIARAKATNGLWKVSQVVDNLSLSRDFSVHYFPASSVPVEFGVRNGQTLQSKVLIPNSAYLSQIQSAKLSLRSWNGIALETFNFNSLAVDKTGTADHDYADTLHTLTPSSVTAENTLTFFSSTIHHDAEILWPGPGVLLTYDVDNTIGDPPPDPTNPSDIAPLGTPDGAVNIFDYSLLLEQFGNTGAVGFHPADIIRDGRVDIFDYSKLLQDFGT